MIRKRWLVLLFVIVGSVASVDSCSCQPHCVNVTETDCPNSRTRTVVGCPCCTVCARQQGQECNLSNRPCDEDFGLICGSGDRCEAKQKCQRDSDCGDDRFCLSSVCADPCRVQNPCSRTLPSSVCVSVDHRPVCQCPQGFVNEGRQCTPVKCVHDDREYSYNQSFYDSSCKKRCTCQETGTVQCKENYECGPALHRVGSTKLGDPLCSYEFHDECCVRITCGESVVDETQLAGAGHDPCDVVLCGSNSECVIDPGNSRLGQCQCKAGYEGDPNDLFTGCLLSQTVPQSIRQPESRRLDDDSSTLEISQITHNSTTLALPDHNGGTIYMVVKTRYKEQNTRWIKIQVPAETTSYTVHGLAPSTEYLFKWDTNDVQAPIASVMTNAGCLVDFSSYGVGESYTKGCDSRCVCTQSGDSDCKPRCQHKAAGCLVDFSSYGVGESYTKGCDSRCVCTQSGDSDCKPRCQHKAGGTVDPKCSVTPTFEDPECCVEVSCPEGVVVEETKENEATKPLLILTDNTYNSFSVAWDDFSPRTNQNGYLAIYRAKNSREWQRETITGSLPRFTATELIPNTEYEIRVTYYEDEVTQKLGTSTDILSITTAGGCYENDKSYAVNETLYRGCEKRCNCNANMTITCEPRCTIPFFPRGSFLHDPLCFEQPSDIDECCVVVACASSNEEQRETRIDPCANILCGPNARCSIQTLEGAEFGAAGVCQCFSGYVGDAMDLDDGCHIVATSKQHIAGSQGCYFHNITYMPGDEFFDGCEYKCRCGKDYEIECEARCFFNDHLNNDDPACEIVEDPNDSCCSLLQCSDRDVGSQHQSLLFDGCEHRGKTYQRHEEFYENCDLQCTCMGYGDVTCLPRCPPARPVADPGRCVTLADPTDECCNVTICDDEATPDVHRATLTDGGKQDMLDSVTSLRIEGLTPIDKTTLQVNIVTTKSVIQKLETHNIRLYIGLDLVDWEQIELGIDDVDIQGNTIHATVSDLEPDTRYYFKASFRDVTSNTVMATTPPATDKQDGCTIDGTHYNVGEEFFRGCDAKCKCNNHNEMSCLPRCTLYQLPEGCTWKTSKFDSCCKEPDCSAKERILFDGTGCEYDGRSYEPGTEFHKGCDELCLCVEKGVEHCMPRCPVIHDTPGCNIVPSQSDSCCTELQCEEPVVGQVQGCVFDGTFHQPGTEFFKGCEDRCMCIGEGEEHCTSRCPIIKPTPGCVAVPSTNDPCCQILSCTDDSVQSEGCIYEGSVYAPGEEFSKGCREICICVTGGVEHCMPKCPHVESKPGCRVVQSTDDPCCQTLECGDIDSSSLDSGCIYEGSVYAPGEEFSKGCREVCICVTGGVEHCMPKCPHVEPKPGCRVVQSVDDPCCQTLQCEDNLSRTSSLDLGSKAGGSCYRDGKSYDVGQDFHVGCDEFCMCKGDNDLMCSPIKCPQQIGFDVVNPYCLEWVPDPTVEIHPPMCCPKYVCVKNDTCEFKGEVFTNFAHIPASLSGCRQSCYCEYGAVTCTDECPPFFAVPPQDLPCEPYRAKIVKDFENGEECCPYWGCADDSNLAADSCIFESQVFEHYDLIPQELTGCDKQCRCERGQINCLEGCPFDQSQPPNCPPYLAHLAQRTDHNNRPCCPIYVCGDQPGISIHPSGPWTNQLPAAPKLENITAEAMSEDKVKVQFQLPSVFDGLLDYVELLYTNDLSDRSDRSQWKRQIFLPEPFNNKNTEIVEYIVENLEADSEYQMEINVHLKELPITAQSKVVTVRTMPLPTTIAPRVDVNPGLGVGTLESNTVELTWEKIPENMMKYIDGLQVKYRNVDDNSQIWKTTPFLHREINSYTITELEPNHNYEVDITYLPVEGAPSYLMSSQSLLFKTLDKIDLYDFDISLEINNVSASSIGVKWTGVPSPDLKFVKVYRVMYKSDRVKEVYDEFKVPKNDMTNSALIKQLKPGTRYQVWIEAYLSNGRARKSNVVEIMTKAGQLPKASAEANTADDDSYSYYGAMVALAIIATIIAIAFLVLLVILIRKQNTAMAPITQPSQAHYNNPSYKHTADVERNGKDSEP